MIALFFRFGLFMLVGMIPLSVTLPTPSVNTQTTYFQAEHSRKCIDVSNNSNSAGARIQQWDCNNTGAQQWDIVYVGGGPKFRGRAGNYYMLRKHGTNMCLDIAGAATHNGARVHLWSCHGGTSQQFLLYNHIWTTLYRYKVSIYVRHSDKCLDVSGGSFGNGAEIVQWDCHLGANQRFYWNGE